MSRLNFITMPSLQSDWPSFSSASTKSQLEIIRQDMDKLGDTIQALKNVPKWWRRCVTEEDLQLKMDELAGLELNIMMNC